MLRQLEIVRLLPDPAANVNVTILSKELEESTELRNAAAICPHKESFTVVPFYRYVHEYDLPDARLFF